MFEYVKEVIQRSIPFWSTWWFHNRRETKFKQIPILADVHNVENDTLRMKFLTFLYEYIKKWVKWISVKMPFTWSCLTLSTVKLNQNRYRGLQVSGLKNRSYSNSPTKSARPRFPVSNAASKHRWPRFALPLCPGGRMITRLTLPRPPSPSLSSESD